MKISCVLRTDQSDLTYARRVLMKPRAEARIAKVGKEYLRFFWIGLLEGDGTIGITFKPKAKRVKCIDFSIEMNYTPQTEVMLHAIAMVVGGDVSITRMNDALAGRRKLMIEWSVRRMEDIKRVLLLLETYSLLTTKGRSRRDWVKWVFEKQYIENAPREEVYHYARNVKSKLELEETRRRFFRGNYENIFYIKPWLSGFLEAEACWSTVDPVPAVPGVSRSKGSKNTCQVPQKGERDLLIFIGKYFGYETPYIYFRRDGSDDLQMSRRDSLKLRYEHVHANPLLGYKGVQFEEFFNTVKARPTRAIDGKIILFDIPKDSLFVKIREDPLIYAPIPEGNLDNSSIPIKKEKKSDSESSSGSEED